MSITLQKDAASVSLPGPVPGYKARARKRQAIGRTAAGALYVYDKGIETYEITPVFESLTNAQKAALVSFCGTTVNGSQKTFTYTDENGAAFTARFLDSFIEFMKVAHDCWDVCFTLELSAMGG